MELKRIEDAADKVGGRFKLTVLMQKRIVELRRGAPALVPAEDEDDDYDIVLDEILQGKLNFEDRFDEDEAEEET